MSDYIRLKFLFIYSYLLRELILSAYWLLLPLLMIFLHHFLCSELHSLFLRHLKNVAETHLFLALLLGASFISNIKSKDNSCWCDMLIRDFIKHLGAPLATIMAQATTSVVKCLLLHGVIGFVLMYYDNGKLHVIVDWMTHPEALYHYTRYLRPCRVYISILILWRIFR